MIQENGHLMLVDFDLSTKLSAKSPENRSNRKSNPIPEPTKKKNFSHFFKFRDSGISPADSVHHTEIRGDSVDTESDSVEKSNSFVGIKEYVAPEIILGHGHGPRFRCRLVVLRYHAVRNALRQDAFSGGKSERDILPDFIEATGPHRRINAVKGLNRKIA
ncbi:AGC kinase family protein [Abeliophyllum distichum]|uniref:non-specific serine/threonine protein kinase n=1 Tax=Abeliophyllum distichum TaxID=126358 RepID=A0ABD1SFY4_9LAMI